MVTIPYIRILLHNRVTITKDNMHPELISIPGINLVIQSYGTMLVLAFIFGGLLARHNARKAGEDPENISNLLIFAMIGGVVGARIFHVIHFWDNYQDNFLGIFKIWEGGLEFLGGFVTASVSMVLYAKYKKMPIRVYMDILAPALMLGLCFGRIGCFLNGCCYGKTCEQPWAVTFPAVNDITELGPAGGPTVRYSFPYSNQLHHDFDRNRGPEIELPADFYMGYVDEKGILIDDLKRVPEKDRGKYFKVPNPAPSLSPEQIAILKNNTYPMKKIHPTQLYSSANGLLLCLILQWNFSRRRNQGQTFCFMLILYGMTRFIIEGLRADSPLEFTGLTISQNLSILSIISGIALLIIFNNFPNIYHKPLQDGDENGKSKC